MYKTSLAQLIVFFLILLTIENILHTFCLNMMGFWWMNYIVPKTAKKKKFIALNFLKNKTIFFFTCRSAGIFTLVSIFNINMAWFIAAHEGEQNSTVCQTHCWLWWYSTDPYLKVLKSSNELSNICSTFLNVSKYWGIFDIFNLLKSWGNNLFILPKWFEILSLWPQQI